MRYLSSTGATTVLLMMMLGFPPAWADQPESYTDNWLQFETTLIRQEKTFQNAPALPMRSGNYQRIEYVSGEMKLGAMLNTLNVKEGEPGPAVVYLHGGFGLHEAELQAADMFAAAGYIVLAPTWRGENQNPGYFECFMGEVADARAAIRWLAEQPFVDPENIYVFGWSVGGGIALNLALHDDIPVRLGGSSAGVYDLELIKAWATEDDYIKFPYDHLDEKENYFRLPLYHLEDMSRPHYTFIGSQDGYAEVQTLYKQLYPAENTQLQLVEIEGDHMGSLPTSIGKFIQLLKAQR